MTPNSRVARRRLEPRQRRIAAGGLVILAVILLAGCSVRRLTWSGSVTCELAEECDAAIDAVLEALGPNPSAMPAAIDVRAGAACPPGWPDCVYGLLPGQRLVGHAVVTFEGRSEQAYVNIRAAANGDITSDRVTVP